MSMTDTSDCLEETKAPLPPLMEIILELQRKVEALERHVYPRPSPAHNHTFFPNSNNKLWYTTNNTYTPRFSNNLSQLVNAAQQHNPPPNTLEEIARFREAQDEAVKRDRQYILDLLNKHQVKNPEQLLLDLDVTS